MAADLMVLDLNEPAFVPLNSAARQIVFSESGAAVDTVLVAGRPVVRGHKLLTVDEAALAAEAAEISPGFRKEVEAHVKRTADLVAPLLEGNRAAWKTQLGVARFVGGPKDS
jgi:5-methylthioadenosine/S-adenosylhomocysteine deaminase